MPFKNFAALEVLTSDDVDNYLMRQGVMTFADATARDAALTGGIVVEGMMAYLADVDQITVYTGSAWVVYGHVGAWTAWTPTLAQGATPNITKSVTSARYMRMGKTVWYQFRLVATGTGSSGSIITVSLPFTAANVTNDLHVGSGIVHDSGVEYKCEVLLAASGTAVQFYRSDGTSNQSPNAVGADPTFAVGSGDRFHASGVYEIA